MISSTFWPGPSSATEQRRARYERLISAALRDLASDPHRPGARRLASERPDVLIYHLRHSRGRARGSDGGVREPRHFLFYRHADGVVTVLRALHDAMDIARHIDESQNDR